MAKIRWEAPEHATIAKDLVDPSQPGTAVANDDAKVPMGSGSVIAAANGGTPAFIPVPIMTQPQAKPPQPPPPQLPKAPKDAPDPAWYVNAFTPPLPPNAVPESVAMAMAQRQQQMQMAGMMAGGYPMPPMGYPMMPYAPAPMPMPGRGMVPLAYQGPVPPNPNGPIPMMAQGYPMPMMPQSYPMPMMGQGYPMPMMPQGYPMPTMPPMPMQQAGYANASMDRPGMPGGSQMSLQQNINLLQTSIYPTQRETAVINLCEGAVEYRGHPQVVDLLMKVALRRSGPDGASRTVCRRVDADERHERWRDADAERPED